MRERKKRSFVYLTFLFTIVFRDQLLAQLKTIKGGDLEAISAKLDILGNTLEYRKYGDSLFEILITGGILGKLHKSERGTHTDT